MRWWEGDMEKEKRVLLWANRNTVLSIVSAPTPSSCSLLSLIPCAPIILSTLSPSPPFLPSPFHRRPPSCGRPTRAGWRWSPAFSTAALASTSARRAEPARPCTWPVSSTMRPWWPCSSQGGPTPPWPRNEVGGALGEEGGRERGGRGREDEEYA